MRDGLGRIEREVVACRRCPRLVAWREEVARRKAPRHRDEEYWGRPVPGFGDPEARLLIVGLAPGAHGANRTGRIFTGDASGDFLFPALWRAGIASRPESRRADDGMRLRGAWISAAVKCVPPDNKPERSEEDRCRPYLVREWACLRRVRALLCLGRIAHEAVARHLVAEGRLASLSALPFSHGARHDLDDGTVLVDSFHVSRQNTNTGRLTPAMFDAVLAQAKRAAGLD